jgi:hypothetical protein
VPARVNLPSPIFVSVVPVTVLPTPKVTSLPFVSIVPPTLFIPICPTVSVREVVDTGPLARSIARKYVPPKGVPLSWMGAEGTPRAVSELTLIMPPFTKVPPS